MADCVTEHLNIDSLNRTGSHASLQSNMTVDSQRSSVTTLYSMRSTRRRQGILNKIGLGVQTVIRRFSRTHKSLTDLEIQILSTMTNFNREEVLQWHEKFLTDCPHGYMTRRQFIAMYRSLCPKADAERFARHIFRAFDLDKSNTVDFREFLVGLSITSTTSSLQTKLEWLFQVFDIDGNGLLTREECSEVIDAIVRFNYCQQGNGENANVEELVSSAKRCMMRIFDNVSYNRRHCLTMSQFVQGCQNDEFISELFANNHSSNLDTTDTNLIPKIDE